VPSDSIDHSTVVKLVNNAQALAVASRDDGGRRRQRPDLKHLWIEQSDVRTHHVSFGGDLVELCIVGESTGLGDDLPAVSFDQSDE